MRRPQQGHPYGPQGQQRRPIDLQGMTPAKPEVVAREEIGHVGCRNPALPASARFSRYWLAGVELAARSLPSAGDQGMGTSPPL
jgi:hypothetical protein